MSEESLSVDDLRALRVVDLKQKLTEIGLPTSGRKEELVIRLSEYYSSQSGDQHAVFVEGGSLEDDESQESVEEETGNDQEEESSGSNYAEEETTEPADDGEPDRDEQTPYEEEEVDPEQFQPELDQSPFEMSEVTEQEQQPEEPQEQVESPREEEYQEEVDSPHQEEEYSEEQPEELNEPEPEAQYIETEEQEDVQVVHEVDEPMETNEDDAVEHGKVAEASERVVPPPVVHTIRSSLFSAPFAPPAFASAASAIPAGLPAPAEGDLDGPPTPAGPPPKVKGGPVPLMSLSVKPPSDSSQDRQHQHQSSTPAYLPKALEDALAFKTERVHQVGINTTEVDRSEIGTYDNEDRFSTNERRNISLVDNDDDEDEAEVDNNKRDKGGKRQKKKKKKKRNRPEEWARQAAEEERRRRESEVVENEAKVEVEYIQEKLSLDPSDPLYRQFAKIFETFRIAEEDEVIKDVKIEKQEVEESKHRIDEEGGDLTKVPKELELDDTLEEKDDDEDGEHPKLSKRKLKKLSRLSVAELKQLVTRPDVVEMHDVTAKDPGLLVLLKSSRNTVPVPRHWCFKRKYLQGKRGIEKPPFELPDFIKKTGIMEMRAALQEKEDAKNLKSKMREKVRPKLGKIDIDYQKLHDAFFKWQTKPRMTSHGDLYYEGKEFEIRLKEKKPGEITDDLRTALGMPVGPNAHKVPPPWLIAMQRYGPPPSYPNLKIPGLNAAIPEGCSFGYHAGGWGKPPVDETGKPLYGDVFGSADSALSQQHQPQEIDENLWGELESESEDEESDEDEDEEEEEEDGDQTGMQTPVVDAGLATPSGMSSVGGGLGLETPELIELRKRKIEADMEGGETPSLYTILPERHNERMGAAMMGSAHTYDIPPPPPLPGMGGRGGPGRPPLPPGPGGMDLGGVELNLNPDEVDLMDTDAMQAKAEAALRENQEAMLAKEDLSDMVAEHAAKQSSKRKRQVGKEENTKGGKKYKEFKF